MKKNPLKGSYQSPVIKRINIDKRISITMTSPPGDPPTPKCAGENSPFK